MRRFRRSAIQPSTPIWWGGLAVAPLVSGAIQAWYGAMGSSVRGKQRGTIMASTTAPPVFLVSITTPAGCDRQQHRQRQHHRQEQPGWRCSTFSRNFSPGPPPETPLAAPDNRTGAGLSPSELRQGAIGPPESTPTRDRGLFRGRGAGERYTLTVLRRNRQRPDHQSGACSVSTSMTSST